MAVADTSVKYITQACGLTILNYIDSARNVLKAGLVTGINEVAVTSVTVASNIATVVTAADHLLQMITPSVGQVVYLTGSVLEGEWRVASIVDSVTYTFETEGVADGAVSGVTTSKIAPLGWECPFESSTAMVFKNKATPPRYLRLGDGPGTTNNYVRAYEEMTDIDTGTNPFPTIAQSANGVYVGNGSSTSIPNDWMLVGDDRLFYFLNDYARTGTYTCGIVFGEVIKADESDLYATLLISQSAATTGFALPNLGTSNLVYAKLCRDKAGLIFSPSLSKVSANLATYVGSAGPALPDSMGNIRVADITLWDSAYTDIRGPLPGVYNPLHTTSAVSNWAVFEDTSFLAGRPLICYHSNGPNYGLLFDVQGPWR